MSTSPRNSWRIGGLASVRAGTTTVAAVVVGIALVVGAVALLVTVRLTLERSGDAAALARAQDIAAIASDDSLPAVLTPASEDEVVQVLDGDGRVVSATPNAVGWSALIAFEVVGSRSAVRTITLTELDEAGEPEQFRVWAVRTATPDGEVIVYAGRSQDPVRDAVYVTRSALLVGIPLLLVVLAGVTWWLVGRALRPVEAVRAEVAEITEGALDRRVPVPATRDEVARLASTLNVMLDRLERASERHRAFVADASHELQSPVASFRTQLEVALAHPASTEWTAVAADLLADTQRLERLTRDLLFLAREDADPVARKRRAGRPRRHRPRRSHPTALEPARAHRHLHGLGRHGSREPGRAESVSAEPARERRPARHVDRPGQSRRRRRRRGARDRGRRARRAA